MLALRRSRQISFCRLCTIKRMIQSVEVSDLRALYKSERKKRSSGSLSNQDMALQHFDTYYSQIFADEWPSIRLALLSPRKYVGVLNRFAKEEEITANHLRQIGREDIIPEIAAKAHEYLKAFRPEQHSPQQLATSSDIEFQGAIEDAVIRERMTFLSALSGDISENNRSSVNEFIPVTEVVSELDVAYRADGKSKLKSSLHLEWQESEQEASPIETVYETADDFSMSRGLKIFALPRGEVHSLGKPRYNPDGHAQFLPLNGSSILPVLALNLKKDDRVLDLCAAPGGKTVLMIQTLLPGKIVCVDSNGRRLERLRSVVRSMSPPGLLDSEYVSLEHASGRKLFFSDLFDKVIVDVPCSGDRYAVTSSEHNLFSRIMSDKRRRLPELQKALLRQALMSCQIGGEVVYSTCTLSSAQNESIVRAALENLTENTEGEIRFANVDLGHLRHALEHNFCRFHQDSQLGLTVLPFLPNNYGPAYLCKLRRVQ